MFAPNEGCISDGFEEPVIASILKETLKALTTSIKQGHIHRDVKGHRGDRQRAKNTFVGTLCWMTPEVLHPRTGYNFKADIWSLGITALELAHGHASFSMYPPMKLKDEAQLALKRMHASEQEALSWFMKVPASEQETLSWFVKVYFVYFSPYFFFLKQGEYQQGSVHGTSILRI